MGMEYDHGRRVTTHFHEMTALEQSIAIYERDVDQLHQDRAKLCSSDAEKCRNDEELTKRREFLDTRRRDLVTQAQVQEGLDKYRSGARKEDNDWIYEEEHHPTGQLVQFMEISGDVKPAPNCDAHHIIPGRGWQSAAQISARLKLHDCNVPINDPDNGVWLPSGTADVPHYQPKLRKALPHSPLHTKAYERWGNRRIAAAHDERSARAMLQKMTLELLNGLENDDLIDTLTQKTRKKLGL